MVVNFPRDATRIDGRTLFARAKCMRLLVTDCDGVLTDEGIYYSDEGELMKRFSARDGMGVERLREAGIATAIVTGERSACVQKRAEKLGITAVYLGVRRKADLLERDLTETRCGRDEVATIGDDVNDLDLLEQVGAAGLTAAPADAMPEVLRVVHYWTNRRGGHGAFREFAEGRKLVGQGQPVYGIAEIGINHNGALSIARQDRGCGPRRV